MLFMKIVTFFLLSVSLTASAKSYSQKLNLSERNVRIEKILKDIKHQSGYVFFYKEGVLDNAAPVSIHVKDASVEAVLNEVLPARDLDYSITQKTVTIVKKPFASPRRDPVNTNYAPPADTFLVRGHITNTSDNVPVQGASVINLRTRVGTQTDKDGQFAIRVAHGDKLQISHINFETVVYDIKNTNDVVSIKLAQKATESGEVVVVGFGKQRKISAVSAISVVKGESLEFPGRSLSTNLQGQAPGVISFQRTGEPGYDNATFWIRGISTFNGAQNPLVLVDGVPRSFNDVDPNEIETFSILKDASATAVFGAEGANGVILVTTKRGKMQKPQITYRGEYSYLTPLRMPKFLGAGDYLTLYDEALANNGQPALFPKTLIDKYRSGLDRDLYPDVNWTDQIFRNHTFNTRHNLSFRGGTNFARYFVSGAFYKESGLFRNNSLSQYNSNIDLKRYNLRSNIDLDVSKTTLLRIDIATQYLETNYPRAGTGKILSTAFTAPPYLYPAVYSDGKIADHPRWSNNRSNPYNLLNNSGYTNEYRSAIQSRVDLEQKLNFITQGLYAKVSTSYDYDGYYAIYAKKTYNSYTATGRDLNGNLIYNQVQSGVGDVTADGQRLTSEKRIYNEASLNYARNFGGIHDVTAMALVYQKERQPVDQNLSAIQRLPFRKMAYVGRATYSYDNRYSIEANIGITGSENFTKEHRWGYFPAVGAAWNVSREKFFPQRLQNTVSNLKLRASYGLTGNDQIGSDRFLYRGGFASGTGVNFGYTAGGPQSVYGGLIEDRFSFPNLSWEKEIKQNYGFDLALFNNRLSIVADYFRNYRYDILLQRQTVSASAGFRQSPYQNFGKVINRGIDASIVYRQEIGNNSIISFRGNFTFARNKVLEIDEVKPSEGYMAQNGNRLNMNYVWVADRLFTDDDFDITTDVSGNKVYALKKSVANQNYFNTGVMPGDIKYKDLNGDGVINQFDRTRNVGNPTTPEIVYGFGAGYEYKGFSINAFFSGVANTSIVLGGGNDAYSPQYSPDGNSQGFFPFTWGVDESSVRDIALSRWTSANPGQQVIFPRLRPGGFFNNSAPSTWWMRDGSFIRLKSVELGYRLPKFWMDKFKLSGAKVYVLGYNLLTFDHIKYWDPEQGNANGGMSYPQSRSFTAGVEITF
jgi:TonB-linked SusC/RagA family outer membrane protein